MQLSVTRDPRSRGRSLGAGFAVVAVLALLIVLALMRLFLVAGGHSHRGRPRQPGVAQAAGLDFGDRFGDGTPDFLRLTDPADQAAFRRWFTLIAEDAAARPKQNVPAEITDCASLLRYAYREALRRHDEAWFTTTGVTMSAPPGEIRKWHYPDSPLGLALFRVRPDSFAAEDLNNGAFGQFADARTLVERNAFLVSRDVRAALPGDLLFYRQFGHVVAVALDDRDKGRERGGRRVPHRSGSSTPRTRTCPWEPRAWSAGRIAADAFGRSARSSPAASGGPSRPIPIFSASFAGIFCEERHERAQGCLLLFVSLLICVRRAGQGCAAVVFAVDFADVCAGRERERFSSSRTMCRSWNFASTRCATRQKFFAGLQGPAQLRRAERSPEEQIDQRTLLERIHDWKAHLWWMSTALLPRPVYG